MPSISFRKESLANKKPLLNPDLP